MSAAPLASIEQLIATAKAHFWTPPGIGVACCVLELENGFTVVGKSICPDPQQFEQETGARMAFADACAELERLEAYRAAMTPRIAIATAGDVMVMKSTHG